MQKLVKEYFNDLKRQRRRRRRVGIAVLLLAVLVVGGVAGILTQYGMAMTGDTEDGMVIADDVECGMEEHQHDEFCYEEVLICEQEEGESHGHDESCYTLETAWTCGLEESGDHVHEDACYETVTETTTNLVCDQEESEGTEGTEGHTHGDDCFGEDGSLVCEQEESEGTERIEGHTHGDACYETVEETTTNLVCTQKEGEGHTHEDACYTETKTLTCTQEETEGHVHGESCYEKEWICEKEEHSHTEECLIDASVVEMPAFEAEETVDQVVISVQAGEGVFPEGTQLLVTPIVKKDVSELPEEEREEAEQINAKYEETQQELEATVADDDSREIAGFLAYDISFYILDEDGEKEEIEPQGEVSVSMDFVETYLPEEVTGGEEVQIDSVDVIHMKEITDEGSGEVALKAEVLESAEVVTTEAAELEKAEFVVDSFSIFTISWTKKDADNIETNITLKAKCVDENGNVLEGIDWEKKVGPIAMEAKEGANNWYFNPQAPYLLGYKLERIVLGSESEMGDLQVCRISYNPKNNSFWLVNGSWTDGKWTNAGSGDIKWSNVSSEKDTLYFVYSSIPEVMLPEIPEEGDKVPAHSKYIKYNGNNDYTLTLDVTGERDTQDIDVLLIVDTSGSMVTVDNAQGGKPRYQIVNDALGELKEKLKAIAENDKNLRINVGVVTFDGRSVTGDDWEYAGGDKDPDARVAFGWGAAGEFGWVLKEEDIKGSGKSGGATNWQAGIRTGESMLSECSSIDRKYVVFLTDGDPTNRYAAGSDTVSVGTGKATNTERSGDPYGNCYDAAVNEWRLSPTLQSASKKYVVNVLDAGNEVQYKCRELAEDIGADILYGLNEEELKESFRTIASDIKYSSFKNVEIHDTLSEYVEFAEETPIFTVTYHSQEDPEPKPLVDESGNPLYTVEYDTEAKTIALKVLNGGELEDGVTYSISFHVKPTEKAVREYIASGYPHTGEEGTDAPDNDTSSGKPGFHSNYDERAKVHYNYNENGNKKSPYAHPVVQVEKPEAGDDVGITKEMGAVDEKGYPITIQIRCGEIENNMFAGSTGDGWTVIDSIAPYTHFLSFAECELNGHKLTLSQDGRCLLMEDEKGMLIPVAEYTDTRDTGMSGDMLGDMAGSSEMLSMTSRGVIGSGLRPGSGTDGEASTGTITWYLNSRLADVVIGEDGKGYCSYSLTYYVSFSDSGKTEIRNTNSTTYISMPDGRCLYPEKMPFFVNIIGTKKSTDRESDFLQGAVFNVYRDAQAKELLAQDITADENGHFAFQLGQSDLCKENLESGQITVYLEEAEAPEGYVRDKVLHPLTVTVSSVTYVGSDASNKANPGIWDISQDQKWGSVNTGACTLGVEHNEHGVSPDFLHINGDSGTLMLDYYNTKPWKILKTSASDTSKRLEGAEFALYPVTDGSATTEPAYTGVSGADGYIDSWMPAGGTEAIPAELLAAGTYEMREIKAPADYAISKEVWLIEISQQGQTSISVKGGDTLTPDENGSYLFKDEILYALPSAGGSGIYWYMIGGTLLMLAGTLILYNKKMRGGAERVRR
ncbi:MAG: LPXTG cell wall anchor domain-containing protein [Lachnospiraceae bacterium]|nr:LPXTG cell wall anchor domain-containing protein [Lachnospiraceae bacterium]